MRRGESIDTARFGRLDYGDDELVHFPGLPGFPDARRFFVREHDEASGLAWLISADRPDLAFVVVDPWRFLPDYQPVFPEKAWRSLGVESFAALQVLVIARVGKQSMSLNLAAPLLIAVSPRKGRQVILEQEGYETRFEVPLCSEAQSESNPQR